MRTASPGRSWRGQSLSRDGRCRAPIIEMLSGSGLEPTGELMASRTGIHHMHLFVNSCDLCACLCVYLCACCVFVCLSVCVLVGVLICVLSCLNMIGRYDWK